MTHIISLQMWWCYLLSPSNFFFLPVHSFARTFSKVSYSLCAINIPLVWIRPWNDLCLQIITTISLHLMLIYDSASVHINLNPPSYFWHSYLTAISFDSYVVKAIFWHFEFLPPNFILKATQIMVFRLIIRLSQF